MMTYDDIESFCWQYHIRNYTILSDMSVDADQTVNLSNVKTTEIPVKFTRVTGHFFVQNCGLTSLKNSPKNVGKNFSCRNNKLTSLTHCPKYIGGALCCQGNEFYQRQLISRIDASEVISDDILWKF